MQKIFINSVQNKTLQRSLSIEYFSHLQQNSSFNTSNLSINCLQTSKTVYDYQSICDIHLTFHLKRFYSNNTIQLIFLSNKSNCSLSILTTYPNVISVNFHQIFSIGLHFRFLHRWSHFNKSSIISWPQWPLLRQCLNKSSSITIQYCSYENTLIHFSSQDLFFQEQTSFST
ncbi:hypothetical protein I4U23_027051 [Adineta vaga]|nr:hypothetical protein I4U23_027051 [Adineta vaga]